jgi:hypothetical protein
MEVALEVLREIRVCLTQLQPVEVVVVGVHRLAQALGLVLMAHLVVVALEIIHQLLQELVLEMPQVNQEETALLHLEVVQLAEVEVEVVLIQRAHLLLEE